MTRSLWTARRSFRCVWFLYCAGKSYIATLWVHLQFLLLMWDTCFIFFEISRHLFKVAKCNLCKPQVDLVLECNDGKLLAHRVICCKACPKLLSKLIPCEDRPNSWRLKDWMWQPVEADGWALPSFWRDYVQLKNPFNLGYRSKLTCFKDPDSGDFHM